MKKIYMSCMECNADCNVSHSMEERIYIARFCPFCGEEILNEDDDLNIDEESEDDD